MMPRDRLCRSFSPITVYAATVKVEKERPELPYGLFESTLGVWRIVKASQNPLPPM